ncbi:MAG TPA: SRPBCC family protein [Burkholderiales bacterium]|nr:SRPBCC family protein [Burkholderiales bacterium]
MAEYSRKRHGKEGRPEQLARGLGWLSVGLGIAQIVAPRIVARLSGVPVPSVLMIACGVRQLACGVGILTQDEPAPWIKARIAGDAADLAALACGAVLPGSGGSRIAINTAVVAGITALDVYCGRELATQGRRVPPRHETSSIEIDRPPAELYRFWRNVSNLPSVMPHLKSVKVIDGTRSEWVAAGEGGARIQWESEIIDDVPNQRIAWRSREGEVLFNAGSVQFAPAPNGGTRVRVDLLFELPPGTLGTALAKLVGQDPGAAVRADLAALKAIMERNPHDPPRLT